VSSGNEDVRRLEQLLSLVGREDEHLRGVRGRLFGALESEAITDEWLASTLANPEGIDRLESFGAKFARMQDTVVDKLLPALLEAAGEQPGAAIDNLNRAERLNLIDQADNWLTMRRLRNRLVHEYFDDPREMAPALRQANGFVDELHNAYRAIRDFAAQRFG
jgi:hypothetical protein